MGWPFHAVRVPQGWTGSRWTRCGDVWHRILPAPMTASPGSSTRPRARTIMHWEWRPSATSSWKRWVQVQTGLRVYLWRLDVLQVHCLLLLCCLMSSDDSWHIRDKLRPVCEHSQYCFTSTETIRLVRMGSPGRPPWLSHRSWTL